MRRRRFLRRIGFALLVLGFALASWRLFRRTIREQDSSLITVRFAHWQLEHGIRDAFDALARDYETQHPNVRIEQMLIPERIYLSWANTHVAGGAAPDIVELGKGIGGARFNRYFVPITEEVNLPNPYNAGTPLASVPWRNTFVDGMESAFDQQTFECYGASVFAATIRVYYNVNLMREVTGQAEPPRTFGELMALCAAVRAHALRTGRDLLPFAGSQTYGPVLLDDLFTGQMQRLASELNPGVYFPVSASEFNLAHLNHEWSFDDPALRSAAEIMRLVAGQMSSGFMQFTRDDSVFQFVQGRALLLTAFSQDSTGILRQANFPIRVFRNPAPAPGDPRFGAGMIGPNSEGSLHTYGAFGITRACAHPEIALDFLRYITSRRGDGIFSRVAGTLPVVVGVEPPDFIKNFMPDGHGFPPGPTLLLGDTKRVVLNSLHLLIGPNASSENFLQALKRDLPAVMRSDLEAGLRNSIQIISLNDTSIEAVHQLSHGKVTDAALSRKFERMVETQNEQEASACYLALRLQQAGQ